MKKLLSLVAAALVMGTMAYGQTNVLSQNAVGYVKVTVDAGDLALVRNDFVNIDGSPVTIPTLLGDQVPANSVAHVWDRVGGSYASVTKGGRGWPAGATNELMRGDAFFLQIPAAAAEASYDVYLLGEVPADAEATVANIQVDAIGYPYPAAVNWTATTLSESMAASDTLHVWDQATQTYVSITKGGRGWPAAADTVVIEPGQAFWVETAAATPADWTETKPYDWP